MHATVLGASKCDCEPVTHLIFEKFLLICQSSGQCLHSLLVKLMQFNLRKGHVFIDETIFK